MKKLTILALLYLLVSCVNNSPNSQKQTLGKSGETKTYTETTNETDVTADAKTLYFPDHPVVNVYLETSGSMNGYLDSGKSQFQQVLYDYLSNIQNSGLPSEMNLHYISDKITFKGNDVNKFVNSLTSEGVLNAPGSKSTTDIAALITDILSKTSGEQISIFISDCIFSPGCVPNPEAYLMNQKIAIRNAIKSCIDSNVYVGCSVYQFFSQFKGSYFDYKNRPTKINMQRPFYIWVFGSPVHIAKIKAKVPDSKFIGAPVNNTWTIINCDFSDIEDLNDYGLLPPSPTNGDYKRTSKKELTNIKKRDEYFSYTFGVDMSMQLLLYGQDYATDLKNYRNIVDKETGEEFLVEFRKNNIKETKYTHNITVYSKRPFSKGNISIVFDGDIPQWISESSDSDDSVLNEYNSKKTYGFNYMCEGIYSGFHSNNNNNITTRYNFVIK